MHAGSTRRRRLAYGIASLTLAIVGVQAAAQSADSSHTTSELNDRLPRPGYEPKTLRFGTASFAFSVDAEARYDSNVFAVSRAPIADEILLVSPRIRFEGLYDALKLHGDVFADLYEYASSGTENHVNFGTSGEANYEIDRRNKLTVGGRYQRYAESRNDPEANIARTLAPSRIDASSGYIAYSIERNRVGVSFKGEVQHLGYLLREDTDRSLLSVRGAMRIAVSVGPTLSIFFQPFINRRSFDQTIDNTGVNRDATTVGATAGVQLPISGRWTGQVGVGGFRSNPDDASLKSFSGVSASADLTWTPRRRTVLTLRGFNGDVATVRGGAIGRTDSRVSLRLDQEVRHNILFDTTIGYSKTNYRGLPNELRTPFVDAQAEYLVDRSISLFIDASYSRRRANPSTDGFDRTYLGIGVRLRH